MKRSAPERCPLVTSSASRARRSGGGRCQSRNRSGSGSKPTTVVTGGREAGGGDRAEVPETRGRDLHARASSSVGIRLQVVERANDAFADRQLRRPAERADPRGVEEDERAVADPAALAAGVLQHRRRLPRRSVIQPIESFTSQYSSVPRLKTLTLPRRLLHRQQHRVDAVLDVEVRLALLAVAEHAKRVGIARRLSVEVEDVAVGVALAEDRDEAEDAGLKAEALAVGLDQALARQLRGAVERGLDRERRVLRRRDDMWPRRRSIRSRRTRSAERRWRASPRAR